MSRRRYVSTDISVDTRVNKLAEESGDFAALLYTWMIPHADDAGELSADLEQLMFTVIPGRRSATVYDVEQAVEVMAALGLIELDYERGKLRFPAKSFYRYQTYVTGARRESAQNSAEQRDSAQNATSLSFPVKFPVSPSGTTRRRASRTGACEVSSSESGISQENAKTEQRVLQFSERLLSLGHTHNPTADDRAAIAESPDSPDLIAEAFAAAMAGKWGDQWLRDNLQVKFVARKLAAYRAALARGFAKNGKTASGDLTTAEQDAKYGTDDEAQIEQGKRLVERNRARQQQGGTPHEPTKRTTGGAIATDRCNLANGASNEHAGTDEIQPGDHINGPPSAASVHRAGVS